MFKKSGRDEIVSLVTNNYQNLERQTLKNIVSSSHTQFRKEISDAIVLNFCSSFNYGSQRKFEIESSRNFRTQCNFEKHTVGFYLIALFLLEATGEVKIISFLLFLT